MTASSARNRSTRTDWSLRQPGRVRRHLGAGPGLFRTADTAGCSHRARRCREFWRYRAGRHRAHTRSGPEAPLGHSRHHRVVCLDPEPSRLHPSGLRGAVRHRHCQPGADCCAPRRSCGRGEPVWNGLRHPEFILLLRGNVPRALAAVLPKDQRLDPRQYQLADVQALVRRSIQVHPGIPGGGIRHPQSSAVLGHGEGPRTYGERLVFWGGSVNTQSTLPFGTPEQVREEVLRALRRLSRPAADSSSARCTTSRRARQWITSWR